MRSERIDGFFRLSIGVLVITAVLFVLFGRDEKIIPSIQYQPPQGMDSAVVGYVVDGSVDDKDVISFDPLLGR